MKLCKDCKWSIPMLEGFALCNHPHVQHSVYDGRPTQYVDWIRAESGLCGPDATLYESRITDKAPIS
jgi:hypothetical protein